MPTLNNTNLPSNRKSNFTDNFAWPIYADATLAGLSVLIPLPFVDDLFENYFRKRMVKSIARQHQLALSNQAVRAISQGPQGWQRRFRSCLLWPFKIVMELVLSLSRKLLYFLSVKKAIDALNYYWQRAFLLNYMMEQGYLQSNLSPDRAALALELVLKKHGQSPLQRLAQEVVRSPGRLVQSVRRARDGQEDSQLEDTKQTMRNEWGAYDAYFSRLAADYEQIYQAA